MGDDDLVFEREATQRILDGMSPQQRDEARILLLHEAGGMRHDAAAEFCYLGLLRPTTVAKSVFSGRVSYYYQHEPTSLGQAAAFLLRGAGSQPK